MPKIRAWPVVAAVLLACAAGLGIVAAHTDLLTARDAHISAHLHALDTGWVHGAAAAVSAVFSPVAGVVAVVVWTAALALRGRRLAALAAAGTLCLCWGAAMVIKPLVARPRPPFGAADGYSFPSGHTALAVAVVCAAFLLARRTDVRDAVVTVGSLVVLAVMFSRVILGAHYLTDTLGAVLAATGTFVAAAGLWHLCAPPLLRRMPFLAGAGETLTPRAPVPAAGPGGRQEAGAPPAPAAPEESCPEESCPAASYPAAGEDALV